MAQKKKTGMRLRPESTSFKNTWGLTEGMISLAGAAALLLAAAGLADFGFGSTLLILLLTAVLCCAGHALLKRAGQGRWFAPGLLLLLLLLTLLFRRYLLEGGRLYWNQLSVAVTEGRGWVLPRLETQLPAAQRGSAIAVFAVVLSGLCSLAACGLAPCAPMALAVAGPILFFAGQVFTGDSAESIYLVLILASAALILIGCGWKKTSAAGSTALAWLLFAAVAFFAVQALSAPAVTDWAESVSAAVQKKIHTLQYETNHTSLPEGDFRDYRIGSKKAEPALTVTMEKPEILYLRGFTGTVFSNDVWQGLETEELVKNRELLYWLNLNAFTPDSQFAAAAATLEAERGTVTIENIGACSRYLYVPFSLCDGAYLYRENLNTDGAFGGGERSYSYSMIHGGSDAITQTLEQLKTSEDAAVTAYRKAESAYRQIVHSQYRQVPEEVKKLLGDSWDEIADKYGSVSDMTPEQRQECALRFLGACFPESGIPEDMELPLDQARGTSYQYATVAVLTMRYFGIPARYAEGYLISEQAVQRAAPGKALTVDSSCARAWAEIYQDGVGWIPIDLTPGLGEVIEEQLDETLEGDLESEKEEDEENEEEQDASSQSPEPLGGTVVKILKKSLVWLLYLLLVLLLLLALLWLRRKKHLERRERLFRDEDVRNAVGYIIADAIGLLEKMGIHRGNGSLRDIGEPIRLRFGDEYAAMFETITLLNDRAVFSKKTMEEARREEALAFRDETLGRLKAETKWYRKLWLKWLLCLY